MKMMARLVAACLAMAVTACGGEASDPAATGAPEPIVVAAASSLTDVMEEIGALYAAEGHPEPRFSFAATSELVRQIEQGAQVDVFVSADTDWMNYLAEKQLIEPGSRRNVASNTLVLIAPAGRGFDIQMGPGMNLRAALGDGRIAIANPDGVPAGTIAVIDDSGGTLTAPILEHFSGVVCAGGTVRSHLGILTREYGIPCLMNAQISGILDGDTIELEVSAPAKTTEAYQKGIDMFARVWRLVTTQNA